MALLVTSCTMGKHPRQLLDKGPGYLRTKTNSKLFAYHRKSAVELLEASKPQFVKSTSTLNIDQIVDHKLNDSTSIKSIQRSKSEYVLNQTLHEGKFGGNNIDQLDGVITRLNTKLTAKPEVFCCINGSQGRKINMSHQKYRSPDSSSKLQLDTVSSQNLTTVGHRSENSRLQSTPKTTKTMSEEEKMLVDNVMTLSTDMSSTQDVEMEYRSSFVQRSHSDLSCQHSRNSSIVSDPSNIRFSRASADLEKFFNGMGIERNILDPMLRRQDNMIQKDTDIFDSISSLDSPDTRSVCSGVSKLSEKTFSSTDCLERTLQSTSVVERNARIIKWLCNIKKAKQPCIASD